MIKVVLDKLKKGAVYALIFSPAISLFFMVSLASIDTHRVFNNSATRLYVNYFFPEGWGFFTKNPNDFFYNLYEIESDGRLKKLSIRNGSYKNIFGLSRQARFIAAQVMRIETKLSNIEWTSFDKTQKECILKRKPITGIDEEEFVLEADSTFTFFSEKKRYIITKFKLVPYDWIGADQELNNEIQFKKFRIKKTTKKL